MGLSRFEGLFCIGAYHDPGLAFSNDYVRVLPFHIALADCLFEEARFGEELGVDVRLPGLVEALIEEGLLSVDRINTLGIVRQNQLLENDDLGVDLQFIQVERNSRGVELAKLEGLHHDWMVMIAKVKCNMSEQAASLLFNGLDVEF